MISLCDFKSAGDSTVCFNTLKRVPGRLQVCIENQNENKFQAMSQLSIFENAFRGFTNIKYFSWNFGCNYVSISYSYSPCPEHLFHYFFHYGYQHHAWYRPALLNGRHVVDVVRAVCGPADVSEVELDRAKRQATEWAMEMHHQTGVWHTSWSGAAVTVQM